MVICLTLFQIHFIIKKPETKIKTQQLTQVTKPQFIHTAKPQQTLQQQEPITDATGIGRAMSNGHTHVIGNTIYI